MRNFQYTDTHTGKVWDWDLGFYEYWLHGRYVGEIIMGEIAEGKLTLYP